jgi:hypothetical protein
MLDFLLARVPKRGGAHAAQAKRSPLADQVLRDAVADKPEMYLDELAAVLFARTGVRVSVSTVHRWCAQLGLTRKRVSAVALARASERVQRLRADYKQVTQPSLPSVVGNILFTDESHFDERSVQRRYGRAPSGQKAVVAQPYNGGRARRERLTLLLAVGVHRNAVTQQLEPVVAARVSSGSTSAGVYADFVARELGDAVRSMNRPVVAAGAAAHAPRPRAVAPAVPRRAAVRTTTRSGRSVRLHRRHGSDFAYDDDDERDEEQEEAYVVAAAGPRARPNARRQPVFVVSDNWSGHHNADVQRAFARLAAPGAQQQFIPPYSPDMNEPIEGTFGDIKRWLRRHHYWQQPALTRAVIERAVEQCVSVSAILGRARRAGYAVTDAELEEARRNDDRVD